jgi:plasmid stabilization system protein ParE
VSDFVLTQAAKGDLLKLLEYLEGDNPSAVLKVVDALDNAMELLADNPGIGHLRPDPKTSAPRSGKAARLSIRCR